MKSSSLRGQLLKQLKNNNIIEKEDNNTYQSLSGTNVIRHQDNNSKSDIIKAMERIMSQMDIASNRFKADIDTWQNRTTNDITITKALRDHLNNSFKSSQPLQDNMSLSMISDLNDNTQKRWIETGDNMKNIAKLNHHIFSSTTEQRLHLPAQDTVTQAQKLANMSTWDDRELNTSNNLILVFNGDAMGLYKDGKKLRVWKAYSGRINSMRPELQDRPFKGPIPEGVYLAAQRPDKDGKGGYQEMGAIDRMIGLFGRGKWPKSSIGWGSKRVWLIPSNETNTYGRDNMAIHGGYDPGSAGCIDLTKRMEDFAYFYKKIGKDIPVVVDYEQSIP